MRIRVRGPDGVSTITLSADATVADLKAEISSKSKLPAFDLKLGYPPKPLDLDSFDGSLAVSDIGIKLDGEQIIVAGHDLAGPLKQPLNSPTKIPAPISQPQNASAQTLFPSKMPPSQPLSSKPPQPPKPDNDPPEIPAPNLQGTLVMRVMPDDNSCLFRALSYAVLGDFDSSHELRSIVASAIQAQPDVYTEAILEKSPDAYCAWISRPDSWGGAIELGILSQHFALEICSVSVQDLRTDRFNEGQPTRCILVYSGIHYDVIVLNPSRPPYDRANASPEGDQKIFETVDDAPLAGALELCRVLQKRHYYTDTAGFTVRCGDCGWQGKGQVDAVAHAKQTGHYNFGEA